MKTISIPDGTKVKLQAVISSDAVVLTGIVVEGKIIRQSQLYKFSFDLDDITILKNKIVNIGTTFFLPDGTNIDQIFNTTQVAYFIVYNNETYELDVKKEKMLSSLFVSSTKVKFI